MLGHRVLNVEDYVGILKRRAWIIAIPVVLLPIIAYGLTFLITPQYVSQTLVLVEGQQVPDSYVKPIVSTSLNDLLASMKERIESRSSIEPLVTRYNLYSDAQLTMDQRVDLVRANIDIKPITSDLARSGGSPGFFISFTAGDPHTAQLVCAEITSLFVGESLRSREDYAQRTNSFVKSQLDKAKRDLDEQDAKLAAFQRQNSGKLPEESAQNMGMMSTLDTQLQASTQALTRMEQDKSIMESLLAQQLQTQTQIRQTSNGSSTVGPDQQQKELDALLAKEADLTAHYEDDYPDVIAIKRSIAELRRSMARAPSAPAPTPASTAPNRNDSAAVQQLRAQIKAEDMGIDEKRKEQAQIQANMKTYQGRIQATPEVEQQYKQLTRDHQTAQTFYDDLLGKMNQSSMATDLEKRQEGEQFNTKDGANLPEEPSSPKRGAFVLAGLACGFALGLLIVAFIEYKDTTFRNERDVWAFTQLPTLAVIGLTELDAPIQSFRLKNPFRSRSDKTLSQARG